MLSIEFPHKIPFSLQCSSSFYHSIKKTVYPVAFPGIKWNDAVQLLFLTLLTNLPDFFSIIPFNPGWLKSGLPVLGIWNNPQYKSSIIPELIINQSQFINIYQLYQLESYMLDGSIPYIYAILTINPASGLLSLQKPCVIPLNPGDLRIILINDTKTWIQGFT